LDARGTYTLAARGIDSFGFSLSPPIAERAGRVLVLEPDDQRRALLRRLLEHEGYDCVFLPDGDELLRLTAEYEPDLILLAANLAGASARELVEELRDMEPRLHYPVILLGTAADEHDVARGLLAGADDFVADVAREQELYARIRVQLRNKRFYDTLARVRSERDNLRRDSQTDALTGLVNRRSLQAEVLSRCQARECFGVLFMDLDHFKSVNDRFGHEWATECWLRWAVCSRRPYAPVTWSGATAVKSSSASSPVRGPNPRVWWPSACGGRSRPCCRRRAGAPR
jgi:PleD family two-component response regulator